MTQSSNERKNKTSSQYNLIPKNPNRRPTIVNMKKSIGKMEFNDRQVIRKATIREYILKKFDSQ